MPKSFVALITEALVQLQDVSTATWNASDNPTEITTQILAALREVSGYHPYLMLEVFEIESRTGIADENKADALVDDGNAQFLSTDVGKVVYNTDDLTWADVTAHVDSGELTLSKDIFPDGDEPYKMFNKNCRSDREIYIGDVKDYVGGNHGVIDNAYHPVEWPLGTKRNVDVSGDILTILLDKGKTMPDSADSDAKVEVFVWFRKRQRVSQLTDLLGAVDGTPAAGAKTLTVKDFNESEIITEDTLFTFASTRGTYRVTADKTLTGGGGVIVFWPGLDDAPANSEVITIIGSTLDDRLERLVLNLTVANARISKSGKYINEDYGGLRSRAHLDLAERQLALVLQELERGIPISVKPTYSRL